MDRRPIFLELVVVWTEVWSNLLYWHIMNFLKYQTQVGVGGQIKKVISHIGSHFLTCFFSCIFGFEASFPKWPISQKVTIFKHFGNGRNVSLELISVYQTIKGNPNGGQDELEPEGDEMPFLTFETRSRFCFLPSRASIQDQDFFTKFQGSRWDRDFCSLNLRLRDEIEIFCHLISKLETR